MSVQARLNAILKELPNEVTLVAVSKTHPAELIMQAYDAGQRVFGENKVQEMAAKYDLLPKDIHWHMIGHLQTNKVRQMAAFVHMIHGVDSLKLLIEINKQAQKHDRVIDCLLQLHIAEEETKFGLDADELQELLDAPETAELHNICIRGLMGMATFTENKQQVRKEFANLRKQFETLQAKAAQNILPDTLSMGMSGDYELAIECGSTMIRIGSSIFGGR